MPASSAESPARLFLLDGYALLYRAFYALLTRPIRSSSGENTSVPWIIAHTIHRLRTRERLTHVVWVNDAGDSFRKTLYPAYKSTRVKLDEELREEFERSVRRVHELLVAWGVPVVEVPGYEADDVIGTLAARAVADGMDVVILSGDKDFHQLVGPQVSLLNPGRQGPGGEDMLLVTEATAGDRLGVPPHQVVDYLALVGDSADTVPGVKGIGKKTARDLLAQYGSIEAILEAAPTIPGKRAREALLAQADLARLSKTLVTIRTDVPTPWTPEAFGLGTPDHEALLALFQALEFTTLIARFGLDGTPMPAAAPIAEPIAAPPAQLALAL